MAVIRRLLYHATPEALQQGSARLRLEDLLERIQFLTGGQNMSSSDLDILNRATNCNASLPTYDCTDYKVLRYRTYDGTCNNFFYPLYGAALTPFLRVIPAEYEDGISTPVGQSQALAGNHTSPPWPSARHISWKVIRSNTTSPGGEEEGAVVLGAGITHMVMQWGQFLDHDLDLSPVFDEECGCNHTRKCFPIHVHENDTTFGATSSNVGHCLTFSRSLPTCRLESAASVPRDQVNQITSFIDGSQVYGSSDKLALSLRSRAGGLLKQGGRSESNRGNLPFQKERPEGGVLPFFIAGDERANEQTGLTVMHTLWLREHNRMARRLGEMNPCWDDERIYQVARKIVGAEMQKITFYDFLPVLFGTYMRTYIPMYRGYNPFVNPSITNSFATAAYRFGHSLVRNQLLRLNENYTAMDIGHLDLTRAFFNPVAYFEGMGTDGIARGLMMDVANPVDEFLNSVLTTKLFPKTPDSLGGDLASLNIQRGRDHGIPSYRTWQQYCEEKFPGHRVRFRDNATMTLLRWIYGPEEGFSDGMDLWVAGLAEERLEGAQLGPTFACILGLSFSRLRDGDRFWFESDSEFSEMQRRAVKQTSLGRVVCDNSDDIRRVSRNVFVSGMVRVACEEIPQLDLQLWKDYSCRQRKPYSYRP